MAVLLTLMLMLVDGLAGSFAIESIEIEGRTLTIIHNQRGRRKFTLRVAREDGERLYKELSLHYPKALYT
jgi:hypothetical protein